MLRRKLMVTHRDSCAMNPSWEDGNWLKMVLPHFGTGYQARRIGAEQKRSEA